MVECIGGVLREDELCGGPAIPVTSGIKKGRERSETVSPDVPRLSLLPDRVYPHDRVGRAGARGTGHECDDPDEQNKIGERCWYHVQRKRCDKSDADDDPDDPVNSPDILFTNVHNSPKRNWKQQSDKDMLHTGITGIPAVQPRLFMGGIAGSGKKIMARVPGTVIGADTGRTQSERTPTGG